MKGKDVKKLVLLVICGCLIISSHISSQAQEEGLTFYLPFDQGANAEQAKGTPAPVQGSHPGELVEGIKGKAMLFSQGNALIYSSKGNYDNARGSLEMWIKYEELYPKSDPRIFVEGGGLKKLNLRILLMSYFSPMRLHVTHNDRTYSRIILPLKTKQLGSWYHFVICWDKDMGTRCYLNGEFYAHSGGGSRDPVLNYKRKSRTEETFSVGPGSNSQKVKMAIDELKIYNRMLTAEEVKQKFLATLPVTVKLKNCLIGRRNQLLKLRVKNESGQAVSGKISHGTVPWDSERLTLEKIDYGKATGITIAAGETKTLEIKPDIPEKSGRYGLNVKLSFGGYSATRNLFFGYAAGPPLTAQPEEAHPRLKLKLLKEFDCTKKYGPEEFCDDGLSEVVDSPLGKYRITGGPDKRFSRFAYRFFIEDVGTLHLAEIEYPDDREFEMEVMIDSKYGGVFQVAENGIIVGDHYPNSNKLKKYRVLFYPPDKECTIMFMNWPIGGGSGVSCPPAAVKSVKIYRVEDGLPAVKMANLPPAGKRRSIGVQDEDHSTYREYSGYALGLGSSEFGSFNNWYTHFLRRFDHMKYIGQNLFGHTVMHYGGTSFPGSPISRYARNLNYPDYWLDLALYLAGQEGLKFNAGICHLFNAELGKLAGEASHSEMINGKDTIYNVGWNGEFGSLTYGGAPPLYNILHPKVQELISAFFDDFIGRYGHYEAFDGFDLWFWMDCLIGFGSLKAGYSDYTVGLFEKETGVKVPGSVPDKNRFVKRYLFLTKKDKAMREKWIAWRCRKVHEFWMEVHNLIQKKRPGTKLTFQCWATVGGYKNVNSQAAIWKRGDINSVYNYYREGGFDLNLFRDIPHLYIGNKLAPNYNPQDSDYIFRDFEFSPARIIPFRNRGLTAIWLQQQRRERDNMLSATPMPDYWLPEGAGRGGQPPRKAGAQIRPNNPFGGHLEKSGAVMPNSDFYLEYYAKCLADWDVREITDGGIGTTTLGAEDELRDFIRAYLTLPTEYFEVFKDVNDPVCVRHWQDRFYVVNREFYPIKVTLKFNRNRFKLLDLAADEKHKVKGKYSVSVGPYRLISYRLPSGVKLEDVEVIMPQEKVEWLEGRLKQLKDAIARAEETGKMVPLVKKDLAWFKKELERAWEQKHYARVRKLLDSYWCRNIINVKRIKAYFRFFDEKFQEKFQREAPPVKAARMNSIPAIDSPEWNNVPAMTEMADLVFWEGKTVVAPSSVKNSVRCVYDDKAIGFLFSCPVQDKKNMAPGKAFRDAEAVEIYISPNANSKPYYHYITCYKGPRYQKRCYIEKVKLVKFESVDLYNPEYTVETEKDKDGWTARIVIPFKELDGAAAPEKGDVWRINLSRKTRCKELGNYWQALRIDEKESVHCPEKFSKLLFQ